MFSLKRKGDYQLQLDRILRTPGRYNVELYLFTPLEVDLSARTLTEEQFYFGSISHRFGLLGIQSKDRASKSDTSYSLLSPHFEIAHGGWLFQYKASMDRLRQQLLSGEVAAAEPIARALRLSQTYAQRMRKDIPQQNKVRRYFRQMDIYFSWFAEQFFLECQTLEGYDALDEELKQAVAEFLQQEARIRKERDYLHDFQGTPTAIWNRMSLYNRLLEYPVSLRAKVTELGSGTRKLVKAASTMVIMSLFTYLLFTAREFSQTLSITVLLSIALIYAIRDLLRDDMIDMLTRWLRKGKPRWRIRLLMPYTGQQLAQQQVWLDYRKLPELPRAVAEHSGKWANSEERQVILYRSLLNLDKAALEDDEIRERITLDCEQLCELIKESRDRLYLLADNEDGTQEVQVHRIERQQDYNLLVVFREPGQDHSNAQRWRLRLGANGVVQCESKQLRWPSPEEQQQQRWWQRLRIGTR